MFHIINFVESEKNGPVIPLCNVTDRLVKMLDISEKSVRRLKQELHQLREKETNEKQRQEMKEQGETEANVRVLRSRTISLSISKHRESSESNPPAKNFCRRHTASAFSSSSKIDLSIPQALPPQKKRPRLAVSALISVKGYHIPSVDIWSCTEEHNMDSTHFLSWLDSTCATLRDEIDEKGRIAICLDNATWHNTLTKESIIPKRSSTKGEIQKWLQDRKIHFPEKFVKAQLLQLVCANCPRKEYMSDRIAKKYAVEIIRLPKLHCSLDPIELSWNNLKQFVRDQNTTFRQDDVKQLIEQFMVAMDDKLATSYFHHVYKVEEMYKTADEIMEEEIEPHMQSDSEETDSEDDEENEILPGFILCNIQQEPCGVGLVFDAQVTILEHKSIICPGYSAVLHIHAAVVEVQFKKLITLINRNTGERIQEHPRFIKQNQVAIARFELSQSGQAICMEPFKRFPQLGRFTLHDEGRTIAIGKVLEIIE
ncbi:unnamed protein product [Rotaria sordida]|uniref:Translation elongation factor EFTu/EF1A C-terminal domain-containing protein n=1 Tax=Rotaria sordida TaxID=392033 RepID=A0A815HID0_9BILA|nr:unnamed protein product [Rotaria sordida]